jgi:hypothetical protein
MSEESRLGREVTGGAQWAGDFSRKNARGAAIVPGEPGLLFSSNLAALCGDTDHSPEWNRAGASQLTPPAERRGFDANVGGRREVTKPIVDGTLCGWVLW